MRVWSSWFSLGRSRGASVRSQEVGNRVAAKHIDFVLCDPRTLAPVLAVELDDASHAAPHRRQRDVLVNEVLRTVGLPLLRVPVQRSYVPRQVADDIRSAIRG